MEIKLRLIFFPTSSKIEKIGLNKNQILLNFIINLCEYTNKVFFLILKKKALAKVLKKSSFNFFLKSALKVFVDLSLIKHSHQKFNVNFLELQKIFLKYLDVLGMYMKLKFKFNFNKNDRRIKLTEKISSGGLSKGGYVDSRSLRIKKNVNEEKKKLLKNDVEQISHFVLENLGKLTSILDSTTKDHLEYIEQIIDHSISADINSVKIQKKIKNLKKIKQKVIFCDIKILFLTIISFMLCKFFFN